MRSHERRLLDPTIVARRTATVHGRRVGVTEIDLSKARSDNYSLSEDEVLRLKEEIHAAGANAQKNRKGKNRYGG